MYRPPPTHPFSPPEQVIQVVCCRLTVLQQILYEHFLQSKATRKLLSGNGKVRSNDTLAIEGGKGGVEIAYPY